MTSIMIYPLSSQIKIVNSKYENKLVRNQKKCIPIDIAWIMY